MPTDRFHEGRFIRTGDQVNPPSRWGKGGNCLPRYERRLCNKVPSTCSTRWIRWCAPPQSPNSPGRPVITE